MNVMRGAGIRALGHGLQKLSRRGPLRRTYGYPLMVSLYCPLWVFIKRSRFSDDFEFDIVLQPAYNHVIVKDVEPEE